MIIPARFNGPDGSGNGGISSGLFAGLLTAEPVVEVTLRSPVPLETPLRTERDETGARIYSGEALIASAAPTVDDLEPVPAVYFDTAVDASTRYDGYIEHQYPRCFVCGTERPDHDGLAVYAGAVDATAVTYVASPFVPREPVDDVLMWAALDCPGGWSVGLIRRRVLLGRMAARIDDVPKVREQCVLVAKCDGWDGRKAFTRSSAYGSDGRLLATAKATWIELR